MPLDGYATPKTKKLSSMMEPMPPAPGSYPTLPPMPDIASIGGPPILPPPLPGAPGIAAANPLASQTGGEIFGAPIRRGVFRDLYRAGKHSPGMAGEALMGLGKPPMAPDDPMAMLPPPPEGMPGMPPEPPAITPVQPPWMSAPPPATMPALGRPQGSYGSTGPGGFGDRMQRVINRVSGPIRPQRMSGRGGMRGY